MTTSIGAVIQQIIEHDEHGLPKELVEVLAGTEDKTVAGQMNALALSGDARALPLLHWLVGRLEVEPEPTANIAFFELMKTIRALGGEFTAAEAGKIRAAQDVARRGPGAGGGLVTGRAPRRNDPCWCGNGKKYKKCHKQADEEAAEALQVLEAQEN